MKSTGIIRRIDDLGRVVIPKEIRRTMRVREGDPMELFIEGDMVIFKKHFAETLYQQQIQSIINVMLEDDGVSFENVINELKSALVILEEMRDDFGK
jgi:AbrB family looped-hinge helix DNA binding protein